MHYIVAQLCKAILPIYKLPPKYTNTTLSTKVLKVFFWNELREDGDYTKITLSSEDNY